MTASEELRRSEHSMEVKRRETPLEKAQTGLSANADLHHPVLPLYLRSTLGFIDLSVFSFRKALKKIFEVVTKFS